MAVTRHSSFDITVSTIADRNALLRKVNHMTVLVRDAIADPDAGQGKATYRWDAYDNTWILVSRSKTDTISFDTEELTIINGKVTPANIILDNQVWGLAIIQNDQIFTEPRMSDLIIDYTGISGLDDYNGMTLKFTYAYGSQAGQVASIIEDAVNTVETELALKANSADVYTKSQVDSKIVELAPATDISGKADITYVDTELALKADKSNVYTKIESDSLLSDKASTTYVDSGLNIIHTQIDNVIVGNDIMPKVSGISNIGSATSKFGAIYTKEMHIDANTLYVDGVPVLGSSANTINISADTNQGIRVATKGTGQTVLDSESSTVIKTNGINADVLIESQGTGSRSRITSDSSVIITAPVISLEGSISGSSTSDLTFRNITATGNLTVQGSTTFVDSTNVSIKDNIIVVNKGELGTGVSLGYAGIQIDRGDDADSRIVWNEASDKFIMGILGSEKNIASEDFVTSAINAIPSVDFSGYYTKAQIDSSLGNKVDKISGKGLSTEDYTTAEKTKLAGIEAGATGDMTATEILNAIKTVDGSGSGLDADTIDGLQASEFATASHSHSNYVVSANDQYSIAVADTRSTTPPTDMGDRAVKFEFKYNSSDGLNDGGTYHSTMTVQNWSDSSGGDINAIGFTDNGNIWIRNATIGGSWDSWNKLWHSGNDGAGSGLDADLLDGMNAVSTNTASSIVMRDASGNFSAGTITATLNGSATSSNTSGTATTLIGDQTSWASYRASAVANMLGWKNYGNGHVIFDASNSTSPAGTSINNTNSQIAWSSTYPTLMGWNGANTYGVRVDSARVADTATTAGNGGVTSVNGMTGAVSISSISTSAGAVGNYALLVRTTTGAYISVDTNYAGSELAWAGFCSTNTYYYAYSTPFGATVSGTWKALGSVSAYGKYYPATLFVRIA